MTFRSLPKSKRKLEVVTCNKSIERDAEAAQLMIVVRCLSRIEGLAATHLYAFSRIGSPQQVERIKARHETH